MRAVAVTFSVFGFWAFLRLVNVEIYHFMPLGASGSEGGLIDAALASIFGLIASIIALIFSFLHFRRAQGIKSARVLLGWSGFLLLGFLMIFVKMSVDYSHAQAAN